METRKFNVDNIKWDVDFPEDIEYLPKEIVVEITDEDVVNLNDDEEIETYISDFISDETGVCHDGFQYEEIFAY